MDEAQQQLVRYGGMTRWSGLVMALFLWAFAIGMTVTGGGLIMLSQAGLGLFLFCLGVLLSLLSLVVQRDALAKARWKVGIGADGVELVLPAGRSRLHSPVQFRGRIDFREIEALILRPEVYFQFGTAAHVEPWWLVLRTGERILLGEDRQVSGTYETMTDTVSHAAETIGAAGGIPLRRWPEVEGRAGLFGIWGAVPPSWPQDKS